MLKFKRKRNLDIENVIIKVHDTRWKSLRRYDPLSNTYKNESRRRKKKGSQLLDIEHIV